jgi:hypothetical protein
MNTLRLNQINTIHEKYNASKNNFEVIFLKGEAGVGKTFLIESFLETCKNQEVLISSSACNYQTGKYEPYLPFKQLIRGLIDVHVESSIDESNATFFQKSLLKSVKTLVDLAPDLIETFVPAGNLLTKIGGSLFNNLDIKSIVEDKLDSNKKEDYQLEEGQIHNQYLSFLRSLSHESPIILILEDIQWLDEASMNLLLPLTQKLKDSSILLIGSYRSNEVNQDASIFPVLNELKRNLGSFDLDMDLKNDEFKLLMINSILDERENQLGKEFREKMLNITNGNPMFINELMKSLEETQQISVDSAGVLQSSGDIDWGDIPEKLEAVVLGRLSKLEDSVRSLLSSASVQGSSFLVQALGKIDQINDRDLLKIFIRSLVKEHKLLKEGKVQRLNKQILSYFQFSNGLIQHYLYNDLMYSERMLYHQEIAEALVELYKGEYDQTNGLIAYHYDKAEIPEKAISFYENAGKETVKISAFKEASLLFGKALDLVDRLVDDDQTLWEPVKLRLLVQKSIALKPNEGWISTGVIDLYNQAYELGVRLNDYETLAPVTFGLWVKHLLNLELDEAIKFAHSYHETAIKLENSVIILEAKISISNTCFWTGNIDKALQFADEVIDGFDEDIHKNQIFKFGQDPRAFAYLFKILSLSLLARKKEAHDLAEQSLLWARSLKHPYTEAIILQAVAWLHFQEETSYTKEISHNLIEISEKYDFGFYLGIGQIFSACWLLKEGEFEEAIHQLKLGYSENLGKEGGIVFHSIYQLLKSRAELGLEMPEEALITIDKAIEISEKQKELVYFPLLLQHKAKVLTQLERINESKALIKKANDFTIQNNLHLYTQVY